MCIRDRIYPEYYVIKINAFNDLAKDSLDEWIYFFKHSKVPENYQAKGLKEVEEKMRIEGLSPEEKTAYERHQLNLISERNIVNTARMEGENTGIQLTLQIIRLFKEGKAIEAITKTVEKPTELVKKVLKEAGLI